MSRVTIQWNGDDFIRQATAAAGVAVHQTGERLAQSVRDSLNKTTGRVIGKTKTGRNVYSASLPGTPPGTRSNRLRGSIVSERTGQLSVQVGTNVEYARIHELGGTINHPGGTPYTFGAQGQARFVSKKAADALRSAHLFVAYTRAHPINMPKRPFLVPGLNRYAGSGKLQKDFNRVFKSEMRRYLKGGAA